MTRVMSNTSREAFANLLPKIDGKRALVLEAIEELGSANNNEIAKHLNWAINRVTGRVTELRKLGKIEVAYKGKNEFGSNVKFWRVADKPEQTNLFEEPREREVVDCE